MMIEKRRFLLNTFFLSLSLYAFWGGLTELFIPPLFALKTYVLFLADILLVVLGMYSLKHIKDKLILSSFVGLSFFVSLFINEVGVITYINGLREFIPFLFVIPFIRRMMSNTDDRILFESYLEKFFKYFLILQFPFSIIQFMIYGAGDFVGGTMGAYCSGIQSTLIFIMTFYLLQKKINYSGQISDVWKNKNYFLYLIPTMLNETRISFVLMIMFLFLLIKIDRKWFSRMIVLVPMLVFVVLPSLIWIYLKITGLSDRVFSLDFYTDEYFLNDVSLVYAMDLDDGTEDIPRFTKILAGWDIFQEDNSLLFGKGLGHFKGGTSLNLTAFAKEYKWLLAGSIPWIFFVGIQLGLIGIVWMATYLLYAFRYSFNNSRINLQIFLLGIYGVILFYNDSFRNLFMGSIFILLMFLANEYDENEHSIGDYSD